MSLVFTVTGPDLTRALLRLLRERAGRRRTHEAEAASRPAPSTETDQGEDQ